MTLLCLCQWCASSENCTRRLMPALCSQTCPPGGLNCAVYSCPDYAEKQQDAPVEAHGSALPAGTKPAARHISDTLIVTQNGAGGKSDANG